MLDWFRRLFGRRAVMFCPYDYRAFISPDPARIRYCCIACAIAADREWLTGRAEHSAPSL